MIWYPEGFKKTFRISTVLQLSSEMSRNLVKDVTTIKKMSFFK